MEYAIFSQVGKRIQPAIWIKFDDATIVDYSKREVFIKFPNLFIAKYMRILAIDAHRYGDSNIDIDYVVPGGFLLGNN